MAIQSNSSEIEVSGGIPLYTGIASVSVVAVNPTLAELLKLGVKLKTEPVYTDVQIGENTYNKLIFWLQNATHDFTTKLEILCKPEHRIAKSGKFLYINKSGQTVFCDQSPSEVYDWYSSDGVRKAFTGEDILTDFVKAWANTPSGGECTLDTIEQVMKGDVTELSGLIEHLKNNKLRVLLGVKDGKYQEVYKKHFGRLKPQRDDAFVRALNNEFSTFKAEYNSDLKLQPYSPELIVASEASPEAESAPW
tara:strand:- start:1980 stop:2729 length:750 start_codon:yes stop_codon:yes gene_type:complete